MLRFFWQGKSCTLAVAPEVSWTNMIQFLVLYMYFNCWGSRGDEQDVFIECCLRRYIQECEREDNWKYINMQFNVRNYKIFMKGLLVFLLPYAGGEHKSSFDI